MKQYRVEYTDSVTGSMAGRDDGHPFRTSAQGADKFKMFKLYREKLDEKGKRYGWKEPKLFEVEMVELDGASAVKFVEEYEETKNLGEGI